MKWIKRIGLLILSVVLVLAFLIVMPSIPREDVLECGLPDGSKFVLTAKYDWDPIARLVPHVTERLNQKPWRVEYREKRGTFKTFKSAAPATVSYSGRNRRVLRGNCAEVGKREGIPLVAYSHMKTGGNWQSLEGFPWRQLDVPYVPTDWKEPLKSKLDSAGFYGTTHLFALIMPRKGRLVYEQPLSKEPGGYYYDKVFDGVYQSFSTDGGKTWSDPIVTTQAEIFQMGKAWLDQCFIARPISINGTKIEPDFPEPCPTRGD